MTRCTTSRYLIARQASTGDVCLYRATSAGKLSARTKIASKWTGYKKVVDVGDLDGEGRADLVSRDTSGAVYRNNGNGKGSFGGRTRLATGRQSYKGVF
ncbi:hypothetical protein IQ62_04965 [Streptomyces scabiei]|uniref:FG-GAP repeat domain-containing protein n=1 Tax=Streptomyces scabiei TaxID=1930 RepID=UPI0004E62D1B|nr:VCBS repeat-containing protein [Streptomyces scabiei]KFG01899.1 hypothetical protein IQ62_04965 [Streptomyces scabiei]